MTAPPPRRRSLARRIASRLRHEFQHGRLSRSEYERAIDPWMPATRIGRRVVAGMATMPTRARTLRRAVASVLRQVDRLYLYLDGHDECPRFLRDHPKVVPLLSSQYPALHGSGKFFGMLFEPRNCLYLGVDDDIQYGRDAVARLYAELLEYDRAAVVGYHGTIVARPVTSYLRGLDILHFANPLARTTLVDTLGTGTVLFDTAQLHFDVRRWPHVNMVDLQFALEASRLKLPMCCIARDRRVLWPIDEDQPDSIYRALKRDDSQQTLLARELVEGRAREIEPRPPLDLIATA